MIKNKLTFITKTEDGQELKLAVVRPNEKSKVKASQVYAKAFWENVEAGVMMAHVLDKFLREQKLWDDDKQNTFLELHNRIAENTKIVEGKVKGKTLAQGRDAAIQLRRDRNKLSDLVADKTRLEATTAEGLAKNQEFAFLVSECTVHADDGKRYFESKEDYDTRSEEKAAWDAATQFSYLYHDVDPDLEKNYPENKFLVKHKMCDEKLRLVNKDGKYVDASGKLIDAQGRYIDADGNFIDSEGNPVNEDGSPKEEIFPFVDEELTPTSAD